MKLSLSNLRLESWFVLLSMVTGCLVLSLCVQPLVDDWIYMVGSGRTFEEFWSCAGAPVENLADALRSCRDHYVHSNGRLTDKLLILFLTMLPACVGRLFAASMFGVGLYALLRLAGGKMVMRSPGFTAIAMLLVLLLPPWDNYLISMACEFNYIVPLGLCLPVLLWMLESPPLRWWMCVVAMLGGWMHESFSLSICAGICVLLVADGFRWKRTQWMIAGFFIAGTLVLMLAPGTFVRIHDAPTSCVYPGWVVHSLLTMPSVVVLVVMTAIMLIMGRDRKMHRRRLCVLAVCAVAGVAIGLATLQKGRAYWFSDFMIVACVMIMLRSVCPSVEKPHRLFGAMVGILICGWYAWLSVTQYAYAKEAEVLSEALREDPGTAVIWADVSNVHDENPWQLRMTYTPLNEHFYTLVSMNFRYARRSLAGQTVVLPARLRGRHYTEWDTLPGRVGAYGSFPVYYVPSLASADASKPWCGNFVFSMDRSPLSPYNMHYKLRKIHSVKVPFVPAVFRIPSSRLRPGEIAAFRDLRTGELPDTLYFIYMEQLPRTLRNCPLDSLV